MATTKPKAIEFNGETGEEIERELTVEEIEQRKIDVADKAAFKAAEEARLAARLSALQKLGLTEEEIQAL